jgi:hypothetical protein
MDTFTENWNSALTTYCRDNLYCSAANAGVEGLGAIGAVNERLLQVPQACSHLITVTEPV